MYIQKGGPYGPDEEWPFWKVWRAFCPRNLMPILEDLDEAY